jgi:hypothetical protein
MAHHDDRRGEVAAETSPTPPKKRSTVLPSGGRVTYEGHREVPESKQVWEIHLRLKQTPKL